MSKKTVAAAAAAACMGVACVAGAADQTPAPNPFGLVYRGAITENLPGHVNIHPVTYKLNGLKIAANVYTPADYDGKKAFPAVVVAHPNGGVKEQVAGLYAQRLAELGYVTIAGLGAFGICGGGGYTLNAAKSDKRFKAVATLSMFNSGEVRRNGYINTGLDTIAKRMKEASDARAAEVTTGKISISGNVDFDALTDESIAKIPTDLYREGMVYYGKTHRHANSTFAYTTSSLMDLMAWDARDQIELIDQPLLMMAGEKADSLYMTEEAFAAATGTKDKELFKIPGATHIQTYFVPEYVEAVVGKLKAFFGRTL